MLTTIQGCFLVSIVEQHEVSEPECHVFASMLGRQALKLYKNVPNIENTPLKNLQLFIWIHNGDILKP